ncbi:TIGR03790 family protein [Roseateles sp. BYS180W]|uniref:TIGR03790 family protein n=1 Tax=Roseateles rivi TaxID=3299028 RepID=UPI0037495C43
MLPAQIGLVINTSDPYSVQVGEYYQKQRKLSERQVLRVSFPAKPVLSAAEFEKLQADLRAKLGLEIQGLALAWSKPYAVECNSITSALALGFQRELCEASCSPSKPSPYFNYWGHRPAQDLGLRPSMLLAAPTVEGAKALIDRGLASDSSLAGQFAGNVNVYLETTSDAARSVRSSLFPEHGARLRRMTVQRVIAQNPPGLEQMPRTLIYLTGATHVAGLNKIDWLPGALADHLTSAGGVLDANTAAGEQMSALAWIEAGATASHGTVSEPCNHLQKFPHPQVLMVSYVQGATALETYWRSVAWPAQSVFVGDPLAAPFAPTPAPF